MNLHLMPDNGFLNDFISISEKISQPGQNIYIVISSQIKFGKPEIKKITHEFVKIAIYGSDEFKISIGDISKYDKIFFHFLSFQACDFILKNQHCSCKMYWMFWGSDLYSPFQYFSKLIYDDCSLIYFKKNRTFSSLANSFLNILKSIKTRLKGAKQIDRELELKRRAINRINYFCHYNPLDYNTLKSHFETNALFLPFFYFEYDYSKVANHSINRSETLQEFRDKKIIQLGNSASLSNNHLSILIKIAENMPLNASVICPLSYGDKRYARKVVKTGRSLLGNNFIPLEKYLSKEEYLKLLESVTLAIMNHHRTEGAGNVFLFLALGKRVMLNKKSNLYDYLTQNGIFIHQVNELSDIENTDLLKPLPEKIVEINVATILKLFSSAEAEKNIRNIYLT